MQIANLEHRLAGLRKKRQTIARQSDVLKLATWIGIPATAVIVTCIAFAAQRNPIPTIVTFAILLSVWSRVAWKFRYADWSWMIEHESGPRNRYTSHHVFIEESITECEKALAELKAARRTTTPTELFAAAACTHQMSPHRLANRP
jgi:hypothetical protein